MSSLAPKNLLVPDDTTYIDCLILHSPFPTLADTLEAWKALESFDPTRVRALGISNVSLSILETVYAQAVRKPLVVQNRFYAPTDYGSGVRNFCQDHGIMYQSFWTLSGNPELLTSKTVGALATLVGIHREVALYALVGALKGNVVALNGTKRLERMIDDLEGMIKVAGWKDREANVVSWRRILRSFRTIIGEREDC